MALRPPTIGSASTPQQTLEAFVRAVNRRDRPVMESLVQNSQDNPALDLLLEGAKEKPEILSVRNVRLRKISSTRVTVLFMLSSSTAGRMPPKPMPDKIDMVKVEDNWLIVAPKPDTRPEPGVLASWAMLIAHPEALERVRKTAKQTVALSNLKQLGIAAVMHIMDHDEKILLTQDRYVKALTPYIKDATIFSAPPDKSGSKNFAFNANLSGREFSSIKDPENTIMFFEGKPGELDFRYDGKAVVGFCDGRARVITPAEAKKLLWK